MQNKEYATSKQDRAEAFRSDYNGVDACILRSLILTSEKLSRECERLNVRLCSVSMLVYNESNLFVCTVTYDLRSAIRRKEIASLVLH